MKNSSRIKNSIIFVGLILGLYSCSEYDLIGDKAIFIGSWKWEYSIEEVHDNGLIYYRTLTPQSENTNYSMEFKENGKYKLFKNDDVWYKDKAKFLDWQSIDSGTGFYFWFYIDKDQQFYGKILEDSIVTSNYFPPFETDHGYSYSIYKNYFVRE